MSVQSEIDRIITSVRNSYSKILEKGGTVPASQTVANLATAIDSIPGLELVANVDTGATVTATLGSKTVTGVSSGGQARLKIPQEGKWRVSATSGMLVSVPQEISVPATIDIALIAQELNDTSWAAIKQVSDANMGANFWSVGDCKEITMNGKVSNGLTLTNYSAWVYIIGFNHNAEREGNGIAFQGFKATKNGMSVALVDNRYNNACSAGYFSMSVTSPSGVGTAVGWSGSNMRQNIMPLIKSAFPSDLQTVIKASTIYTDNSGQGQGSVTPTATQDDVFLLAEYEIFGQIFIATRQEADFCKQYAYYAAGNSKIKYRHDAVGTATVWFERSPYASYPANYGIVTEQGKSSWVSSNYSRCVSPCFKV